MTAQDADKLIRNPPLSLMNDSRCSFDRGQGSPVLAVRVLWHVGWL